MTNDAMGPLQGYGPNYMVPCGAMFDQEVVLWESAEYHLHTGQKVSVIQSQTLTAGEFERCTYVSLRES